MAEAQCRCGARWTGLARCHCGVCHITFNALTPFDRHRRNGECIAPADAGLIATQHPFGEVWGAKPTDLDWRSLSGYPPLGDTGLSEGHGERGV